MGVHTEPPVTFMRACFRVKAFGVRFSGFGFRAWFADYGFGFRVLDLGVGYLPRGDERGVRAQHGGHHPAAVDVPASHALGVSVLGLSFRNRLSGFLDFRFWVSEFGTLGQGFRAEGQDFGLRVSCFKFEDFRGFGVRKFGSWLRVSQFWITASGSGTLGFWFRVRFRVLVPGLSVYFRSMDATPRPGAVASDESRTWFWVSGFSFQVSVSGSRVSSAEFRVSGLGFKFRGSRFGSQVSDSKFRGTGLGFQVPSFGFGFSGFRFRVSGFGLRASGPGSRVLRSCGFRVSASGFRVSCFWFYVSGLGSGFRVSGFRSRFRVSGLGSWFLVSGFGIRCYPTARGARLVEPRECHHHQLLGERVPAVRALRFGG